MDRKEVGARLRSSALPARKRLAKSRDETRIKDAHGICGEGRDSRRDGRDASEGFPSRAVAEDFPVRLAKWRRVWVERIEPEARS